MRSAKSVNSLTQTQSNNINFLQQQDHQQQYQYNNHQHNGTSHQQNGQDTIKSSQKANNPSTSPICRCRVMYLGSSVPHITKDGLQGIQEPLNVLYPDKASLSTGNAGIDSWLSVWSNGILIENVDETGKEVKKFFKIEALHYCAAVKFVPSALQGNNNNFHSNNHNPYTTLPNGRSIAQLPQFLPLDSPHARQPNPNPPIFASILRRTTGIKVLECHAFICKREAAANALVRCCFHAYADTTYAKQIGADINGVSTDLNNNNNGNNKHNNYNNQVGANSLSNGSPTTINDHSRSQAGTIINGNAMRRAKSIGNFIDEQESQKINKPSSSSAAIVADDQHDNARVSRPKSINGSVTNDSDNNNKSSSNGNGNLNNLWNQQRFSKSLHHLNDLNERMIQQVNQQSYYNPYASRVPSYPPQNLLDPHSTANGGTLRSIKSMAANSIASTLLRSKKHARAMSMAQLNQEKLMQQQQLQQQHQPNSLILQPIPPMFLPNLANRAILNGSQTMKPVSSSSKSHLMPTNFEAMTHKEMKKLLKKNAKYGLEPALRFPIDDGLSPQPPSNGFMQFPPIPSIRPMIPIPNSNKSGTMMTSTSMFSDIYGVQPPPPPPILRGMPGPGGNMMMHHNQPPLPLSPDQAAQQGVKQILVKPTAEFLKSKAGKKWLKQQKQFKKLLPPHLDGLPIVFGPPPVEALETANIPPGHHQSSIPVSHLIGPHHNNNMAGPHPVGLPMMDSSGYYAQSNNGFNVQNHQHPGQNGRASAASTMLRYSPQYSQPLHEHSNLHPGDMLHHMSDLEVVNYQHQNHQQLSHQQQHMHMQIQMPQQSMQMYPGMHHGPRSQTSSIVNGHANHQHNNSREMMIGDESSIAPSDFSHQQQQPNHQRHFNNQRFIMPQQKQRNHMVEQSVISLGDENDYEDDEEEDQQDHYSTPHHHQPRQNSIDEVGLFF